MSGASTPGRLARAVVILVGIATLVGAMLLGSAGLATPAAHAQPSTSSPQPTEGIETIRIDDRDYPRLTLADGRRWYLAPNCPWPSDKVPSDSVCGGNQVILRDATDLKCTFVLSYRPELMPQRATWRFCLSHPPLSPADQWNEERNEVRIAQLRNYVGSCIGTEQGCMEIGWWPRAADGVIDCDRIPLDKLGGALAAASRNGADFPVVVKTCRVLNAYMSNAGFAAGTTAADLNLAGKTVADGVPIGTSTAPTDTVVDWDKIGDSVGDLCSIPNLIVTMGALCGAQTAVDLWGAMDCAVQFDKCLAEAGARAMLTGLELTLGALKNPTSVDLANPELRSIFGAVGTISLYLILALFLINALVAVIRMRPREIAESGLGVVQWAFALGVGLTLVALAITISDGVADWFAGETAQTADAVYARFFVLMATLATSQPTANGWLLVALVFLFGALAAGVAFLLLMFRQGAIVLAVCLLILQMAGSAGTEATRRWSRKGRSVLWAAITAKPVSVVVFRLGEFWIGQGRGLADLVIGVGTLGIAAFAPFVVIKFFSLDGEGGSSRGSATMTAAMLLTSVATRQSTGSDTLRANAPAAATSGSTGSGGGPMPAGSTGGGPGGGGPNGPSTAGSGQQRQPDPAGAGQQSNQGGQANQAGQGQQQQQGGSSAGGGGSRSALTGMALAATAAALGGQGAMDGVATAGGATDSPYPDQLPYLPPSNTGGGATGPAPAAQPVNTPSGRPLGPTASGGRW